MADADETKKPPEQLDAKADKSDKKSLISRLLPWMMLAVVVVVCAGAGFVLGRFFGGPSATQAAPPDVLRTQQAQQAHAQLPQTDDSSADLENTWYYDLEPVVANLNDPGVTRYARVTLTLQVSNDLPQKKGSVFFTEKNPILKNWLTIYLASQTVEDMRGDRNLKRIQSEILEAFNEKLFPNAKPQIKRVLFKEFAIQ
jgi:flagellar basal body-associated protein FliL